jgi:hypothetical protein
MVLPQLTSQSGSIQVSEDLELVSFGIALYVQLPHGRELAKPRRAEFSTDGVVVHLIMGHDVSDWVWVFSLSLSLSVKSGITAISWSEKECRGRMTVLRKAFPQHTDRHTEITISGTRIGSMSMLSRSPNFGDSR